MGPEIMGQRKKREVLAVILQPRGNQVRPGILLSAKAHKRTVKFLHTDQIAQQLPIKESLN